MAIFNLKKREIECKIVYYGPGRCGKTTNLEYIFKTYKKQIEGEMVSVNTEGDRTLFFDFLPIGLGKIKGCEVRVQLYTVPGQVQYSSTRKLVLRGVDGVIFVADSLEVRREKNMISLKDLQQNLKEYGVSILKIPLVTAAQQKGSCRTGLFPDVYRTNGKGFKPAVESTFVSCQCFHGAGGRGNLKGMLEVNVKIITKRYDDRVVNPVRELSSLTG